MNAPSSHHHTLAQPIFWFSCCLFFLYFSLSLTSLGSDVFKDTDHLWHLAAGDLIRKIHALPAHDTWSFTAGDYTWYNIAWLWDIGFSIVHEQLGWHGAIAINSIIIALTIALIYFTCMIRSGDFIASTLTAIGVVTMSSVMLRPLQFTNLFIACWILLIGAVMRKQIKACWLFALPIMMLAWVNIHGGFLVGFILLGAFFLQALYDRQRDIARALFFTGVATALAALCNPYGIHIIDGTLRTLTSVAKVFIEEWQPFKASPGSLLGHIYLVMFCIMVPRRPLPVLTVERWLSYFWLFMGLISNRNLLVFAIISAPLLACSLQQWLEEHAPPLKEPNKIQKALIYVYNRWSVTAIAAMLCLGAILWLPTPMAAKTYDQEHIATANLDPELDFIKTHYPNARLLTHYNLGGIIAYQTLGKVPVFVDPRAETAYPTEIMKDFIKFLNAEPGWESVMDQYKLDGIIIPNDGEHLEGYNKLYDRFDSRNGWKLAFRGPTASIFMLTHEKH